MIVPSVPMFTGSHRCPNLVCHAPHAPCEHELRRVRVARGACEALRPTTARGRAEVHRFTYGCPNLAWHAPHALHEHEFHRTRVSHMCEALQPTAAHES